MNTYDRKHFEGLLPDTPEEGIYAFLNMIVFHDYLMKKEGGEVPSKFHAGVALASDVIRCLDTRQYSLSSKQFVVCGQPGEKVYVQSEPETLFGMEIITDVENDDDWWIE